MPANARIDNGDPVRKSKHASKSAPPVKSYLPDIDGSKTPQPIRGQSSSGLHSDTWRKAHDPSNGSTKAELKGPNTTTLGTWPIDGSALNPAPSKKLGEPNKNARHGI